ncbi:MAG: efflux RND transporter periplasmic adaptor subunit [Nitrospirae bacterium]|nr:efflux RND transporter periplasmic adaptor subunit [Nitrospirota bacterium]
MRSKWWIAGGIFVAAILLILFVIIPVGKRKITTDPKMSRTVLGKVPVEVVSVKDYNIEDIIGASGEIREISTIHLSSKVSARVRGVYVDLGSMVKTDQVLLDFDTTLIEAGLLSARDFVGKTKMDLDNKKTFLSRIRALYEKGIVALAELESAESDYKDAIYNHSDALFKLQKAESDRSNAKVTAPVAGVIMERAINPGEVPAANQSLFTIGRIDNVLLAARVSQDRVGDIYNGQEAEVTFDAYPNLILKGVIVKIDPMSDSKTRTFSAFVKLNNPGLKLKPGLSGFARIKKSIKGLAIPSIAIIAPVGSGEATVFVVDKEYVVHLKRVSPGVSSNGMTEILGGLQTGDTVVTVGQLNLRDGDKVSLDTKKTLSISRK